MISLSSQPFLLSYCSGCSLNDPLISHSSYFPNNRYSLCALMCKRDYLLKILSYKKQGFHVKIRCLPFQLNKLSRFHYYHNLLSSYSLEDDVPLTFSRSDHIIYKFFIDSSYLTELIHLIKLFHSQSSFTFYTDSS